MDDLPRTLDDARRTLYRRSPAEFIAARRELASSTDDPVLAAEIRALRKPTTAAWVVNSHAAAHPEVVTELLGVGAALRSAQAALDHARLRAATMHRHEFVVGITSSALAGVGRSGAGVALRADVAATFDAAIADPAIAAQLGQLQGALRWSGFGFTPDELPALTLVPAAAPDDGHRPSPGHQTSDRDDRDDRDDAVRDARVTLTAAEQNLDAATATMEDLIQRIRRMRTRLATLQNDLDQAGEQLSQARAAGNVARAARHRAQAALDRLDTQR